MIMKKYLASITLLLCTATVLSGCGSKSSDKDDSKTEGTTAAVSDGTPREPVFEITVFDNKLTLPSSADDLSPFSLDPLKVYASDAEPPYTLSYLWYDGSNGCRFGQVYIEGDYESDPENNDQIISLEIDTAPVNPTGEDFTFDYMGLDINSYKQDVSDLLGEPDEEFTGAYRYYVNDDPDSYVQFSFDSVSKIKKIKLAYKSPDFKDDKKN
ncbi:MAG: hypothetical protein IKO47_12970 [Ruminococcus sp.]|nr:hypothetical protein [Ruminococcus sp.]